MIKWPRTLPSWKHLWYLKEKKTTHQKQTNKTNRGLKDTLQLSEGKYGFYFSLPPPIPMGNFSPKKYFNTSKTTADISELLF